MVFPQKKKKKKTPNSVHIFKVEGIWHINELKNE